MRNQKKLENKNLRKVSKLKIKFEINLIIVPNANKLQKVEFNIFWYNNINYSEYFPYLEESVDKLWGIINK